MANQSSPQSVPKLCPRCGAFYQDLASKTCPQCFAKLDLLSDDAASALITEQSERASDPEILRSKAIDDEKFKEQAFGACFSVVLIGIATVIVCVVLVVIAAHHYRPSMPAVSSPAQSANVNTSRGVESNAVPSTILGSAQTEIDSTLVLPGSLAKVVHAVYADGVQVYAVPSPGLTDDQNAAFRLAVSFAAKQHSPELVLIDEPTRATHFIVLAPGSALASQAAAELIR